MKVFRQEGTTPGQGRVSTGAVEVVVPTATFSVKVLAETSEVTTASVELAATEEATSEVATASVELATTEEATPEVATASVELATTEEATSEVATALVRVEVWTVV
jgi:hypothetical protein